MHAKSMTTDSGSVAWSLMNVSRMRPAKRSLTCVAAIVAVLALSTLWPGTADGSAPRFVTGPMPPASPEGLLPEERQNLGDPGRVQKFHDFVTRYGLDPVVAVFAHERPAVHPSRGLQMNDSAIGEEFLEMDEPPFAARRIHKRALVRAVDRCAALSQDDFFIVRPINIA